MKECTHCHEQKEEASFRLRSKVSTARKNTCITCDNERSRMRSKDKYVKKKKPLFESDNEKECRGCGEIKPIEHYPFQSKEGKLRNTHCTSCEAKRTKGYRDKHKERMEWKITDHRFVEGQHIEVFGINHTYQVILHRHHSRMLIQHDKNEKIEKITKLQIFGYVERERANYIG